ncbi:hypothetical protein [Mangrovitalea sediminis]|uniref:hypothetical protein n=1 Tax=Mangrovitalea sediminis TaxID=1982043 RepID=UPI001177B152|nr:hypothetical protein [Mangrovitalea sediminis]
MPLLRFRHNASTTELSDDAPARFGVLVYHKNGKCKYMPWAGFIDLKTARKLPKATPVKINVMDYKIGGITDRDDWIKVGDLQAVQGCYINGVVFAVVDGGIPRLVLRKGQDK